MPSNAGAVFVIGGIAAAIYLSRATRTQVPIDSDPDEDPDRDSGETGIFNPKPMDIPTVRILEI